MTDFCYFVLGTRPEIVKLSPVIDAWATTGLGSFILHSGQHYDFEMDQVFFEELGLPPPDRTLGVGSNSPAVQTARVIEGVEETIKEKGPGVVVVQGDTNTALGGALGASKLPGTIAVHVEAGCRSFNREMPEELNRIVVDHIADLLFAATPRDLDNLSFEGLRDRARLVGSTGIEACALNAPRAVASSTVLDRLGLSTTPFALTTVHRQENTDNRSRLEKILVALEEISRRIPIVFPLHPRTAAAIERWGLEWPERVVRTSPLGYLDFLAALKRAKLVLTDSGGIQEEAAVLGTRCFTLRSETEWVFTVDAGTNTLVGVNPRTIVQAVDSFLDGGRSIAPIPPQWPSGQPPSHMIVDEILRCKRQ